MKAQARLAHIDALRGLAALAVLYQHLLEYAGRMAAPDSLLRAHLHWSLAFLDFGKVGVLVFFAISGYIVPFSFRAESPRSGFVLSRFFRLYPAYWLSLALAAVLLPALGQAPFTPAQLAANATMLQSMLGVKDVLGVYWTLAVELAFYGLCFVLFCMGRLYSPRALTLLFSAMLALAAAAAWWRGTGHAGLPVALPLYLAVMLFGTRLRLAHDQAAAGPAGGNRIGPWVMLALLVVLAPAIWATAYDDATHRESVLADASAFVIALPLFMWVTGRRFLALRPLAYAGAISYSIYLFHPLALDLGAYAAAGRPGAQGSILMVAVTLAATWAAAHAVHRWVELPAIGLGRRLAVRRPARLSAAHSIALQEGHQA